jgi:Zn-dependent protease
VIAIVFHEVAHGHVANMLGDSTAAEQGRLSFNPVRHVDPFGTVVLPLMLSLVHAPIFGWAKPVPVNGRRLRNPRLDNVLVALAGPLMNLCLATLAAGALAVLIYSASGPQLGTIARFVADNLFNFVLINAFVGVFNLLPIYPFDGAHVVEGVLPRSLAADYKRLEPFGLPILLILIVVLPALSPSLNLIGRVVAPIANAFTLGLLGSLGLSA